MAHLPTKIDPADPLALGDLVWDLFLLECAAYRAERWVRGCVPEGQTSPWLAVVSSAGGVGGVPRPTAGAD